MTTILQDALDIMARKISNTGTRYNKDSKFNHVVVNRGLNAFHMDILYDFLVNNGPYHGWQKSLPEVLGIGVDVINKAVTALEKNGYISVNRDSCPYIYSIINKEIKQDEGDFGEEFDDN
jgi:hypothetical protein